MTANVFHHSNQNSRSETRRWVLSICTCQSELATIDRLGKGGVYKRQYIYIYAYSKKASFLGGALVKVVKGAPSGL